MERLCQSFGIGAIHLNSYPYESKVLFPARYKELDFKTIDKLCNVNKDFDRFVELTENLLSATEKYLKPTQTVLKEFCDKSLTGDESIREYCLKKNIPFEKREIDSKGA